MTSIDPGFLERIRRRQEQFDEEGWKSLSTLDLRGFEVDAFGLQTDFLRRSNLSGTTLRNSLLARADFTESEWTGGGASNSSFYKSDFSHSTLANVTFIGCDFVRTEMLNCTVRNVTFVDCHMSKVNLRHSHLERVTFEKCVFDNSRLSEAVFIDCSVQNATVGRMAPYSDSESEGSIVRELRAEATGEQVIRPLIAFGSFNNEIEE